jgi:hypothetical protein
MAVTKITEHTTHEELVEYLSEHHTALVPFLPDDTTGSDLFKAVQKQRPLQRFFLAIEDTVIGRDLERLSMHIEDFVDEAAKSSMKWTRMAQGSWFNVDVPIAK